MKIVEAVKQLEGQFQKFELTGSEHHFIEDRVLIQVRQKLRETPETGTRLYYGCRSIENVVSAIRPGEKVYVWGDSARCRDLAALYAGRGCKVVWNRMDGGKAQYVKRVEEPEPVTGVVFAEQLERKDDDPLDNRRDIHTVTFKDLIEIDGMGSRVAQDIVDQIHKVNTWKELSRIKGVGPHKIAAIKERFKF